MCAPTPPAAPDYAGAAAAQGQANVDAARATSKLSNPSVKTPLGTRQINYGFTYDAAGNLVPTNDRDTVAITDSLTPTGQKLYDTNVATQQSMADLGLQGANKAGNILGQTFDINAIPGIEKTENFDRESIYNSLVARAENQNMMDRDNVSSNLIANGIPKGSVAYDREMDRLDRTRTDARQQANLAAGAQQQQQLDARRQMITEALTNRQYPINEIGALRSGTQVAQPQFQNFSGATVQPAPVFAASQAQGQAGMNAYNQEVASNNAMMSGLFSIGAGAAGAPAGPGGKPWWMGA